MQATSALWCVVLFVWIFTVNSAFSVALIVLSALVQGLLVPGFDIGGNNIMMGHAPKEGRSMFIAVYFTVTMMVGVGLANAAGGWMLDNVFSVAEGFGLSAFNITFTRYHYIFGLTALLRCLAAYVALPRMLHEERHTRTWVLVKSIIKLRG
jgi:MFS family permease